MPSTGHSTTISGQIYYRGTQFYPLNYQRNFVRLTTQNFQMLKQISRIEKQALLYKNINSKTLKVKRPNVHFILL